jgi:MtN3 and saliva related transmembrane protein
MNIDLLGYIAATFSTFAMLPQAVHVWRTGQVEQLSLYAFGMATIGAVLWLGYGLAIGNSVIIAANTVGLFIVGYIAVRKVKWLLVQRRTNGRLHSTPSSVTMHHD